MLLIKISTSFLKKMFRYFVKFLFKIKNVYEYYDYKLYQATIGTYIGTCDMST